MRCEGKDHIASNTATIAENLTVPTHWLKIAATILR